MCRANLEARGLPFPPGFFQAMAVRGELPTFVGSQVLKADRSFSECIHTADTALVTTFHELVDKQALPLWWKDTSRAPPQARCTFFIYFSRKLVQENVLP
eukprot:Tamp_22783.p1 GENE.Tamp_22783~~Tamp_22783.p1  ORF type:complete len:100 (-),score=1.09 Tamp_22783:200-499(-)